MEQLRARLVGTLEASGGSGSVAIVPLAHGDNGAVVFSRTDRDGLRELHARLLATGLASMVLGYASVDSLPPGGWHHPAHDLLAQVSRGELPLALPNGPGETWSEVGPRHLGDTSSGVRCIRLPLGGHTRGSVNVFIVELDRGVMLIDAGLASETERLQHGLALAGVLPGQIRAVVCTHAHADHVGGASALQRAGWLAEDGRIVLHRHTDRLGREMFLGEPVKFLAQLRENGVGEEELPRWRADLRMMAGLADWPSDPYLVSAGARLDFGEVAVEIVGTPGHCPDHIAILLHRPSAVPVVFLGDMTLGSRFPRCGVRDWESVDPIGDLLESWHRVAAVEGAIGLPAHGPPLGLVDAGHRTVSEAYEGAVEDFLKRWEGRVVSAAEIAEVMTAGEQAFGPRQFELYGAIAMLHHLEARGFARRVPDRLPVVYRVETRG